MTITGTFDSFLAHSMKCFSFSKEYFLHGKGLGMSLAQSDDIVMTEAIDFGSKIHTLEQID